MMDNNTPIPPCPICGSDGAIETDGFMERFGRYWCPDCGGSFGERPQWTYHDGVQCYSGTADDTWVRMSARCPHCEHEWEAVAPLGAMGIQCPMCLERAPLFEWRER